MTSNGGRQECALGLKVILSKNETILIENVIGLQIGSFTYNIFEISISSTCVKNKLIINFQIGFTKRVTQGVVCSREWSSLGKKLKEERRGKVKCHSCPSIIYKIKVSNMDCIRNIRKPREKKWGFGPPFSPFEKSFQKRYRCMACNHG